MHGDDWFIISLIFVPHLAAILLGVAILIRIRDELRTIREVIKADHRWLAAAYRQGFDSARLEPLARKAREEWTLPEELGSGEKEKG